MTVRLSFRIFLFIFFLALTFPCISFAEGKIGEVIIKIKSSPEAEFYSELVIKSNELASAFENGKSTRSQQRIPFFDTYITVQGKDTEQFLLYDSLGHLHNINNHQRFTIDQRMKGKLDQYIQVVRKSHYGQFFEWDKATKVLPRGSVIEITDLETGLTFLVQRRAGSQHADVQPLTFEDTKIMKEIYQGKWSWKRRAILVDNEGIKVAASMHGMPHGKGAIRNGFPGHFCLHFYGSTTHGSGNIDLSHQAMVHKAAGKLFEFVESANPYELIDLYFIGLIQEDPYLLNMVLAQPQARDRILIKNLDSIRRLSSFEEENVEHVLSLEIPVEFVIKRQGEKKEVKRFVFLVKRDSYLSPWKLDNKPF